LEHLAKTRFGVPKITFIVTPPFAEGLKNQAILRAACSKNARIRASWAKFQKSFRGQESGVRDQGRNCVLDSGQRAVRNLLTADG